MKKNKKFIFALICAASIIFSKHLSYSEEMTNNLHSLDDRTLLAKKLADLESALQSAQNNIKEDKRIITDLKGAQNSLKETIKNLQKDNTKLDNEIFELISGL